ncbi:MAG TPA: hypothetical protein VHV83_01165 [Armatimonadota bacterium]|nr:hypothetical protein [Armatimonadota bacterium]
MRQHFDTVKVWLLLVLPLLTILIGTTGIIHTACVRRARLTLKVPTPTLPRPNAYDTFCQAGDALVDNAAIKIASKPQSSLALKQRVVEENSHAIALFHRGLTYQYLHPPVRTFEKPSPYKKWRELAMIHAEDSQVQAAKGDWSGATQSAIDTIHFGIMIPHGAPMIGTLVGLAIQKIGRSQLWQVIDHLSASEARDTEKNLAVLSSQEVPSPVALQEELWCCYAVLQEEFLKKNKQISSDVSSSSRSRWIRQMMIDVYTDTMLKEIENSRLPYTRQKRLAFPSGPMAVVAGLLATDCRAVNYKISENHTHNLLLTTALALRAYWCEHGRYPTSLHELTPEYLVSIPNDPFATRGTFHYRRHGKSYLLYSVGPDGKDNGGTPLIARSEPGETNKRINADSTGDMPAWTSVQGSDNENKPK